MRQHIVNIKRCEDCPNRDHSGAFTQGGAIPLCRGVAGKGPKTDNWPDKYWSVLPFEAAIDERGGRPYRKPTGVIPDWCPLPEAR